MSEDLADGSGILGCDVVSLGELLHVSQMITPLSGSSSLTLGSSSLIFGCLILGDATIILTLSDPMSNLVQQYDFPVQLRCRKTSDTVFVAFVRPLSEPIRRFSSCSTDFSQQIAQVVLFLFLCFSFLKL
jgi:hypothetical protein